MQTKNYLLMMKAASLFILSFVIILSTTAQPFVQRKGHQFMLSGKPYYYIGANYWYGSYLGLEKDKKRGVERLQKELDFLVSNGINNLRVLAGAEGSGQINGIERVGPSLQPTAGKFNADNLDGLDLLLFEMGKRNMKAVIFLSNNWEWSGGFLQYLNWNNKIEDSVLKRKLTWDEMRDYVSQFYTCDQCKKDYTAQVKYILGRTNKYSHKKYINDPAIMAWELANEPRPMRPAAKDAFLQWNKETAALIKSLDKNHLVTTGSEGEIGTEGMDLYETQHSDKNIDYLTIHIWPKNWAWFSDTSIARDLPQVVSKTEDYIKKHIELATKLNKPLVVEEFGLPRNNQSFAIAAPTTLRDTYYKSIFAIWQQQKKVNGVLNGCNFWAFGGTARPIANQIFWKKGDELMGDPPMEEQGLNAVFDADASTWKLIRSYTKESINNKK